MPLTLDKCGNLGGDVEMVAVVKELALRHPEDEFALIGRNSGERPEDVGLPSNVVNHWVAWGPELRERVARLRFGKSPSGMTIEEQLSVVSVLDELTGPTFDKLDALVLWVGQHGSSNAPIPRVDDRSRLTKPQDSFIWYASYLLNGVNRWRDADPLIRDAVYLNADARNRHKMRDLKHPLLHPVLTQYNFNHGIKHERYGANDRGEFNAFLERWRDSGDKVDWRRYENFGFVDDAHVWKAYVQNVYSRLEVNGLASGTPFGDLISFNDEWRGRARFGLFINEARAIGIRPELQRVNIMNEWVMPLNPHFIHGTWGNESMRQIADANPEWNRDIRPAPWSQYYPKLHSVKSTFTTPSSGSGWATAKPWEAFAAGTVCFFHPGYDDQDNILGDAHLDLREFLRVKTPEDLTQRVNLVNSSPSLFGHIITLQRRHFDDALREKRYLNLIERRIYG